ncbi:Uncharacterised protein [Yersinia frederiksenii]|nr:Uncharacterised protein [Yersinia frederiksenii]
MAKITAWFTGLPLWQSAPIAEADTALTARIYWKQ